MGALVGSARAPEEPFFYKDMAENFSYSTTKIQYTAGRKRKKAKIARAKFECTHKDQLSPHLCMCFQLTTSIFDQSDIKIYKHKSNLDTRGNGQPLEPVFEIPLHMMQKVQLNSCL